MEESTELTIAGTTAAIHTPLSTLPSHDVPPDQPPTSPFDLQFAVDEDDELVAEADLSPIHSEDEDGTEDKFGDQNIDDEEDHAAPIQLTGDRDIDKNTLDSLIKGSSATSCDAPKGVDEGDTVAMEPSDSDDDENDCGGPPKTKHEVLYGDLPPLKNFEISPDDPIVFCGTLQSILDTTIVILCNDFQHALDIGSYICDAQRRPVGQIEEVFGPVTQPMYTVRPICDIWEKIKNVKYSAFAADDDDEEGGKDPQSTNLPISTRLFYVPSKSTFVQADPTPGSDASNFHDEEVPLESQEYSDDEKETEGRAKAKLERLKLRNRNNGNDSELKSVNGNGNYSGDTQNNAIPQNTNSHFSSISHSHSHPNTNAYNSVRGGRGRGGSARGRPFVAPPSVPQPYVSYPIASNSSLPYGYPSHPYAPYFTPPMAPSLPSPFPLSQPSHFAPFAPPSTLSIFNQRMQMVPTVESIGENLSGGTVGATDSRIEIGDFEDEGDSQQEVCTESVKMDVLKPESNAPVSNESETAMLDD